MKLLREIVSFGLRWLQCADDMHPYLPFSSALVALNDELDVDQLRKTESRQDRSAGELAHIWVFRLF